MENDRNLLYWNERVLDKSLQSLELFSHNDIHNSLNTHKRGVCNYFITRGEFISPQALSEMICVTLLARR